MDTLRIYEDIEEENCGEIKLQKLGDALRYGLTNELPEYIKKNEGSLLHFYGSIACLYLYGSLPNQVVNKIDMEILIGSGGISKVNTVIEEVARLLFEGLKNQFNFETFDELEMQLNLFRIPKWCFYAGMQLVKYYANNSYLCDGVLYYIGSSDDDLGSALMKIDVKRIGANTDLEEDDDRIVLHNGFRRIYGLDSNMKRVYLDLHGHKSKYAYYDIVGDKLVICENRFHALKGGTLFVVTDDNYVAIAMGESIHKLKEFQENAKYELRDDCFFVYPDELSDDFFYPYHLFFDGKVILADKTDAKSIIWERISSGISGARDSFLSRYFSKSDDSKIPMPKELSIYEIRETLSNSIPSSERCRMKGYVLLDNLLDIIASYIDKKKDITRLLFALCEANSRIYRNEKEFPSEELYWRLKEIAFENKDESNSLAALLHSYNYELLISEITKENGVKTGLVKEREEKCRIGFIYDSKGKLKVNCSGLEDGMFVGNHIIPIGDASYSLGVVSFDAYTNIAYVTTNRTLSSEERLFVTKQFKLNEIRCSFVVQPINKRCLEMKHNEFIDSLDRSDEAYWEKLMQMDIPDEEIWE